MSNSAVIFEEDGFLVTRETVRHGSRSWPVSTIVKVTDSKRPFGRAESAAIGVALLFALYAISQFTIIWIAIGLVVATVCVKYVLKVFKNQYIICIELDSGTKETILLTQQGVAFRLRTAIRAAMQR